LISLRSSRIKLLI